MNVRQKLVELLQNAKAAMKSENLSCDIARNMFVVDFMMANGVTVQDRTEPMTNADRIRAMSDEELAELIKNIKVRAALCKAVKNNAAFEELCSAEWLQMPEGGE